MLSKKELRALSEIGNGADDIPTLSRALALSISQTYKIVRSLSEKEFTVLEHGTIIIEKRTHIALLLDILNDSSDSYIVLSDSGMDVIRMLITPHTVSEISSMTGLHQTTITRKIDQMRRMGMVRKKGTVYSINEELWPKIMDFAGSYDAYIRLTDPRIPFGSEVYHSSDSLVVFSSNRVLNSKRTAFSKYGDFGMDIHPGTNYYCSMDREPDIKEAFLHSLYIVDKDKSWRNKMLALIFYVMNKDELNDIRHPVADDMRTVLNGGRIKGWIPLEEMNERAKIYGVDLYDN
ncbi:MAG: helix-turn-helix domain-containing protein [Candidatus Methanoplasma sp.]|jgi:DNA-binding MarR family transcriptional regulator|nr:helix-turn-helix domain-containing protein [Candidatus Methanoplasma sp.]